MLPTHHRYRYSSIVSRPDYTWPGGRRLAVYVAVNIEAFGYGVGKGVAIAPPDQARHMAARYDLKARLITRDGKEWLSPALQAMM